MNLDQTNRKFSYLYNRLKQGETTLPVDLPYDIEGRVFSKLMESFNKVKDVVNAKLIEEGLLSAILPASYNPDTEEFDDTLLTSFLKTKYSSLYTMGLREDLQADVREMWVAGSLAMQDALGETRRIIEDTPRGARAVLGVMAAGATAGAIALYVAEVRQGLAKVTANLSPIASVSSRLQNNLDIRATNYYNMTAAWGVEQARSFGRLASAYNSGVETLVWETAGDELVCADCLALEGLEFNTSDLFDKMVEYSQASLADASSVLPWVHLTDTGHFNLGGKDILPSQATVDDLVAGGVGICPLHGRCRCDLVPT
jgi:hypothetical protein